MDEPTNRQDNAAGKRFRLYECLAAVLLLIDVVLAGYAGHNRHKLSDTDLIPYVAGYLLVACVPFSILRYWRAAKARLNWTQAVCVSLAVMMLAILMDIMGKK